MFHSNCLIKSEKDIVFFLFKKSHSFLDPSVIFAEPSHGQLLSNFPSFYILSLVLLVFSSSDVVSYIPLLLLMNGHAKFLNIT